MMLWFGRRSRPNHNIIFCFLPQKAWSTWRCEVIDPIPELPRPPRRVVSLVPSLTESLFDLGLGDTVAGVTDFCVYPPEAQTRPKVGGPKNARLDDILALKPDLVLANREENARKTVEALRERGIPVWVATPLTVDEALETLWGLVRLFRSEQAALQVETLSRAVEMQRLTAPEPPLRTFVPIWYDRLSDGTPWWMTFNAQTYMHDLLALFGGANVFADRERRYPLAADLGRAEPQDPGERDTRYPRVTLEEIVAAQPEVILLPDEPFPFDETHRREMLAAFADTPAARAGRVYLVEGSLLTWHGTRLGKALQRLPAFFSQ